MDKYFCRGFEKKAGVNSEAIGIGAWLPLSVIPTVLGLAMGPYPDEDKKEVDERDWSNVLIPGLGPYRGGRRFSGEIKKLRKLKEEKSQQ